jgi:hypothetical protein
MRTVLLACVVSIVSAAPLAAQPETPPTVPAEVSKDIPVELLAKLSPEQLQEYLLEREHTRTKLAKVDNGSDQNVAILVPGFFFATLLGGIFAVMYARFRKDKQVHETLRLMIEKGTPIPPELLHPPKSPTADLKRGIIFAAAGLGLSIMIMATEGITKGDWTVGLIPMLVGAGYIASFYLARRFEASSLSSRSMSPLG